MRTIEVKLPKGFMNVGITVNNNFIADTNNSANWDTLKFPLPRGRWSIKKIEGKKVVLRRKKFLLNLLRLI